MGSSVWYIARPGPTPEDAQLRIDELSAAMRAAGLIAGEDDPDSILGAAQGPAYRPGPRAEESLPPGYGRATELRTNGAEFIAAAIFNWSPLNVDEFTAPCCGALIDAGEIVDKLGTAAGVEKDFSDSAVTASYVRKYFSRRSVIISANGATRLLFCAKTTPCWTNGSSSNSCQV